METGKDRPLTVRVERAELVIRIGVNTLANAAACGNEFHHYDDAKGEYIRNFAVIDPTQLAKDILRGLEHEEEDGSSPLTKLFDQMIQGAIDDGSIAVEMEQEVNFGEKSPLENW